MLLRACPDPVALPEGWVVRHPGVPKVQHLNTIRLRTAPSAARLLALAEHWQVQLPHRRVAIEDGSGDALEPELASHGWFRERVVLMAMDAADVPASRDHRAREIDEAQLRRSELELFTEANGGPFADPGLPAQLSAAQARLRAATPTRRFAAGDGAELDAIATLFCDPDVDGVPVAQLESVGTRAMRRERGLGDAAVRAALAAARDAGAELIVVAADADDWPQLWYSRLGFAAVAQQLVFHRDAPA